MEEYNKLYNVNKNKLQVNLINELSIAKKDKKFCALLNNLKVNDKVACKYTSKLEKTVCELNNCQKCSSLMECKNSVEGFVYYPTINQDDIDFEYRACKYKKKMEEQKKEKEEEKYNFPKDILEASFKDVDVTDKKRAKVIKYIKKYLDNYKKTYQKGLYLHGNFGCGKSYLIACLVNELKKKDQFVIMKYFQTMLTDLKNAMEDNTFNEIFNDYLNCDVLVIDDLGAENLSYWARDEVLGNILQYRMDNKLSTFITSNLNLEELEDYLIICNKKSDIVKSRRIIERIKQLMEDMEIISINRRK